MSPYSKTAPSSSFFIERDDDLEIAGNIYKGKVQRVLPGMQAAFVDIGLKQAAFIYVNDVLGINHSGFELLFSNREESSQEDSAKKTPAPAANHREHHIEEYLTEGQEIMVQVAKSPIGNERRSCHVEHIASRPLYRYHADLDAYRRFPKN